MGLLGVLVVLGIAFALSVDRRRALDLRLLAWGLGLPLLLALVTLRTPLGARFFVAANAAADAFISCADAGIRFVFGDWPRVTIVSAPGEGGGTRPVTVGFVFAVRVLPIIVFVASVMAVLYHLGVMQRVVAVLARLLARAMRLSGAEALSAIGDIFLGMTEAPLLVRPYVARMTESELFAVMTAGMATISGSVLFAYVAMGLDAGFLVTASFMAVPAAVLIAKVMVPETGTPETMGVVRVDVPRPDVNVFDAAARGASEGLQLALNVGAMLVAFVALAFMADRAVATVGGWLGFPALTLSKVLGWPMAPLAWSMGVPWYEAPAVGALLGTKIALNEFLAYRELVAQMGTLSPRTVRIATFSLCGFANFGSLAILLGGMGVMVPERRGDIARLGLRAIIAGTLATCLTGTVAGLVGG